jgi:tetrapyrrole methylase family protein/MazG family protein
MKRPGSIASRPSRVQAEVGVNARLTIVGLGPGTPELVTRSAWHVLENASDVYLRTTDHPLAEVLSDLTRVHGFDDLYVANEDFQAVYDEIVAKLLELARQPGGAVYAVPGDPMVGEATVQALIAAAEEASLELEIHHGISFIEPCLALVGYDAIDGLTICDALDLAQAHHPPFPPDTPVLISQVHSQFVASEVKLTLLSQYPPEHEVFLLQQAGTDHAARRLMPLHAVDQIQDFGNQAALFIPALPSISAFESFQETVAHLRAPEGCPWDREQTHQSLRMHLMEEAYEALHALDADDMPALQEELGDLLLQIVLQAQIAAEGGDFNMADVIASIQSKIIRRHPHVFEGASVQDVDQVLHNWESLKAEERRDQGQDKGAMDGVPAGFPALAQADEIQSRAARVGFDWRKIEGVIAKVQEEFSEVERTLTSKETEAEIGDLLFAIVNFARWRGVEAESALRGANLRFRTRFNHMEQAATNRGKALDQLELDELEALWQAAKQAA